MMKTIITIVIVPIAIFVLQEVASYILNIFFDKAGKEIPSITTFFEAKKREKFYKTLESEEYKKFELEYLKNYYSNAFFSTVNEREFSTYSIEYDDSSDGLIKSIREYDKIGKIDEKEYVFKEKDHMKYKTNKYFKQYHRIVGKNIKAPNRPGFMLKEIEENESGCMTGYSAYVGTYAENVYSNHVLEYELYKLFCMNKRKHRSFSELYKKSYIRNKMHKEVIRDEQLNPDFQSMRKSLMSGEGRYSLLSVQMIVLIKNGENYDIKLIQRSRDVAVAPGRFQLVPSGGFEILNDSVGGYSEYEVKDNFSAGCAIFREYLEEIFGMPEFEGQGRGSVNEVLLKDEKIVKIIEFLESGKAKFKFLGSVIDLAGLRHELSFALVIDDESYIKQKFVGNEEMLNHSFISNITDKNFMEQKEIWRAMHGPSAVMWQLFCNHRKDIIRS